MMRGFFSTVLLVAGVTFAGISPSMAQEDPFAAWLRSLEQEAIAKGIRAETVHDALDGVALLPRVIELDKKQPEFSLTLAQYQKRTLTKARVEKGRKLLAENRVLLEKIGAHYGVQPRFIVALWGMETDFGRATGGFAIIDSLVSLAYDGRRSAFFRTELLNALQILDEEHIKKADMTGSWAGAMGQCQFMPTSFLKFAQDWDKDGHRDIWNTKADVFASAANYLHQEGWKGDETWGRMVRLPKNFPDSLVGLDVRKSLPEWAKLGVTLPDGKPLPTRDIHASVIRADNGKGQAFVVYDNYRVLRTWNRSILFAVTVGQLADRIGG